MVGFAIGGIVLRQQPGVADRTREPGRRGTLPAELAAPITGLIDSVVANPLGVGIVGLLIALYSGIGWMGNLRKATRAIWRPEFEEDKATVDNFVVATLKDLGSLAGLGVAIVVSLGLSTFGSQFAGQVLDLLGFGDQAWLAPVITIVTLLIAMAADVLIFMWVYTMLPGKELRSTVQGAVARLDHRRRRVRDPQVRVDRAAAQCRLDVEDCGHLRPGDRVAVLLQPGRPAGVVRRRLDRHRRGRTGTGRGPAAGGTRGHPDRPEGLPRPPRPRPWSGWVPRSAGERRAAGADPAATAGAGPVRSRWLLRCRHLRCRCLGGGRFGGRDFGGRWFGGRGCVVGGCFGRSGVG